MPDRLREAAPARTRRGCPRPRDGTHTFAGPEEARTHNHPDGPWCRECDRDRPQGDGTPVAHDGDPQAGAVADEDLVGATA